MGRNPQDNSVISQSGRASNEETAKTPSPNERRSLVYRALAEIADEGGVVRIVRPTEVKMYSNNSWQFSRLNVECEAIKVSKFDSSDNKPRPLLFVYAGYLQLLTSQQAQSGAGELPPWAILFIRRDDIAPDKFVDCRANKPKWEMFQKESESDEPRKLSEIIDKQKSDLMLNQEWLRKNYGDKTGDKLCKPGQEMHVRWHTPTAPNQNGGHVGALPPDATYYLDSRVELIPGGTAVQVVGPGLPHGGGRGVSGGLLPFCRVRVSGSGEVLMVNVDELVPN